VLSYNHSSEITILMSDEDREERKKKPFHQPSLIRQILYTLLITSMYAG
jgi:hypothetical protein